MVTFVKVYRLTVKSVTCLFLQIFLPILHSEHWFVYCVNLKHNRIDVLNSKVNSEEYWKDAENKCKDIMSTLQEALQKCRHWKQGFAHWRPTRVECRKKIDTNDSALFAMYFLEHYNGDMKSLQNTINSVSVLAPF